jgi:hypothetical protein
MKKVAAPAKKKTDRTVMGTCYADHATPLYSQKLALTSTSSGGRSVGKVYLRTKSHGVNYQEHERAVVFIYIQNFKTSNEFCEKIPHVGKLLL